MNEAERNVLINEKTTIKANLVLEPCILDELLQDGILTGYQVQQIQAEKIPDDRIDQLLFCLARRGCEAFSKFVDAMRKHSPHLADMLEKALEAELNNRDAEMTNQRADSCSSSEDVSMNSPDELTPNAETNFPSLEGNTNLNIGKYPVPAYSTFNHLHQQNLNSLYCKLKTHMTSNSMRELSFNSPVPVSFEMIDELLEDMFNNLDECYTMLGGKDRTASLRSLIIELKQTNTSLRKDLKAKDGQRNKYADNIMKLNSKLTDKQALSERIKKDNENLKKENEVLQTQIQDLSSKNEELEEKVNHLQAVNEDEKKKADENLANFKAELEVLGTKHLEEMEELKCRIMTSTSEPTLCQLCQKTITHEQTSHRTTHKVHESQSRKETRRGSGLTDAEQKFLAKIKSQNQNYQNALQVSQSQTRLFTREAESSNHRERYTQQLRKSRQPGPPIYGARQGATPVPSMSRTNSVMRSHDPGAPNPALRMAFPVKTRPRHNKP